MKKYVCVVCSYVHEGRGTGEVPSAEHRLDCLERGRQTRVGG